MYNGHCYITQFDFFFTRANVNDWLRICNGRAKTFKMLDINWDKSFGVNGKCNNLFHTLDDLCGYNAIDFIPWVIWASGKQ